MKPAEQDPETTDPELLLPWYATGRLSETETALVEAWLAENEDAREHLQRSREEMDLTIGDSESLGAPRPEALSSLMARIAVEKPAALARPNWMERVTDFFSPRMLAYAAALAIAVLLVQTATIGVLLQKDAPVFETASAPAEPVSGGTVVLMAFHPSATIEQVSALMNGSKAVIIGGPDPAGIYRVLVPDGGVAEASLKTLATAQIVRFFAEAP
ncbi:MAG: hypothetical protein NXI27_14370 [Alphaproteobacteria bacterium]|nr:hypothetical protein [Alphaproteobacteria bacterium]